MRRRDFVRTAVAAAAAPTLLAAQQQSNATSALPAPVPWTLGLNPSTPIPAVAPEDALTAPTPHFFTTLQFATLTHLADILMPPLNNHPGALAAEAPAFLDFLLGQSDPTRQRLYRTGLDWLDTTAHARFSAAFSALTPQQASLILQPLLRTWMSDHPPTEPHVDFVNIAHADLRDATVNSRAWNLASPARYQGGSAYGLYWQPIQPDLDPRARPGIPAPGGRAPVLPAPRPN